MENKKLRHLSVMLSTNSEGSNDYVLGRITGIVDAITISGDERLLIIRDPKIPESYALRLWATDEEFERIRKTLRKLIGTKLVTIDYYNVISIS